MECCNFRCDVIFYELYKNKVFVDCLNQYTFFILADKKTCMSTKLKLLVLCKAAKILDRSIKVV